MEQHPVLDPDRGPDNGGEAITVHHSVHHPRRVDVRIHGAVRGALEPPVDDYSRFVHRVLWYVIMGILTIAVAFGAAYWVTAKGDYRICVERNAAAGHTNMVLSELADAEEQDGDSHSATVLRQFRRERSDLPSCDKPPFTADYRPGN